MANEFLTKQDYRKHKDMLQANCNAARAEVLLDLLEEYLVAADLWEKHYHATANKDYRPGVEKTEHLRIQSEYTLPLMRKCQDEGVRYATLLDIIPTAFKTNSEERWVIYDELVDLANSKWGLR